MLNSIIEDLNNILKKITNEFLVYINKFNPEKLSISIISNLKVKNLDNKKCDLNKLSNILIENNNTLIIYPYNIKIIKNIYKSISDNNFFNFNIIKTNNYIKLISSEITNDKRIKIVNLISKELENTKINIRNIRRNFNNKINLNNKNLGKDNKKIILKNIDIYINKCVNNLDKKFIEKKNNILKI